MSNPTKKNNEDAITLGDPLYILNEFYGQVVIVKKALENNTLEEQVIERLKLDRPATKQEMAEVVSSTLQRWIENKRSTAKKILTEKSYSRINEAFYIAAALADELFLLEIDWPGKEYWHQVLLEERIFDSSYAGEKFYNGMAKLLKQRVLDPQQINLLAVYFLALRLHFYGRYRGQSERLQSIRKQLFKRISVSLRDDPSLVCPQCYESIFSSLEEKRLAPLIYWKKKSIQGFLVYLLLGWVVWISLKGVWTIAAKIS